VALEDELKSGAHPSSQAAAPDGTPSNPPLPARPGNTASLSHQEARGIVAAIEAMEWLVSVRRVTAGGKGACLGLTSAAQQAAMGYLTATDEGRHVVERLNESFRSHLATLGSFTWSSWQINVNAQSVAHRDYNNVGLRVIGGFGNYVGGALIIENEHFCIKNKFLVMDGAQVHSTADFQGCRYSVVAFTHGRIDEASQGQLR